MKSLLLSASYFPPQVGGISHMMARIAAALGPDQVCCLTGVPAGEGEADDAPQVPTYRQPRAFHGSRWTQGLHLTAALLPIWLRERPRAAQLATVREGKAGLLLHRTVGLPYLVYAHGNEILDAIDSQWTKPRTALQTASRVVANSHFTADLVGRAGVDPERIEIVHPGCDTEHYRPLPPDPELRERILGTARRDPVIVTVGNLVARKGHDRVIRALPRVIERVPTVKYLVVGDGPHRAELEREARAAGIADRVAFTGRVSLSDLPRYYALGDVFVMPSRQDLERHIVEGFGMVYIEANACGKPVVAGRSGGVVDAVVEGETGFLVDPHDCEAIAGALVRVLSDPDLATRLGRAGHERAVRDFTWTRVGRDVAAIVEAIAGEGPPAGLASRAGTQRPLE